MNEEKILFHDCTKCHNVDLSLFFFFSCWVLRSEKQWAIAFICFGICACLLELIQAVMQLLFSFGCMNSFLSCYLVTLVHINSKSTLDLVHACINSRSLFAYFVIRWSALHDVCVGLWHQLWRPWSACEGILLSMW